MASTDCVVEPESTNSLVAKAVVSVHALSTGHFTLPEHQFVYPSSKDARRTVPSLAFLIQHVDKETHKQTRILFDLGLRHDITRYPSPIQKHIETRKPIDTENVVWNLEKGGLTANDINYIIYSHVHWDHIGDPDDFKSSTFVVGHGTSALLRGESAGLRGGHSFFERDLLPADRKIELSDPSDYLEDGSESKTHHPDVNGFSRPWKPYKQLPHTLDVFGDGSMLIVAAPGHLPGHINILARISETNQVYLGGDACHDRRLLSGEKRIGQWEDAEGHICCIHADRQAAQETIERIRVLGKEGVEVIFAHDVEWENVSENKTRFFGYY